MKLDISQTNVESCALDEEGNKHREGGAEHDANFNYLCRPCPPCLMYQSVSRTFENILALPPPQGASICERKHAFKESLRAKKSMAATGHQPRLPTMFVNHGGGPLPLLGQDNDTAEALRGIPVFTLGKLVPAAILIISAHWESSPIRVSSARKPTMLYDYGGFPEDSYAYKYPAPGNPALAARVAELLQAAGHDCALDGDRGFDHGVFVPLMLAFPEAKIPVVALSLDASLGAEKHLAMGAALEPLRAEGVLILGSGQSYHNMRVLMQGLRGSGGASRAGGEFDDALSAVCTSASPEERRAALAAWSDLPGAREAHPREEHLLPLLVCAGAAGNDIGVAVDRRTMLGSAVSSFIFGETHQS